MSKWPSKPTWINPSNINKGNEYTGGDGIYYSDLNAVVNNLQTIKNMLDDLAIQIPLIAGKGKYSVIANDRSNLANGNYSFAGGSNSVTGTKAFKILAVKDDGDGGGTVALSSDSGLDASAGQQYNIAAGETQIAQGYIAATGVTANFPDKGWLSGCVRLSNFKLFNLKADGNNYLYITGHPELGDTQIGNYGFAFNGKAANDYSFTAGKDANALGKYGVALGQGCLAGYKGFATNYETKGTGLWAFAANQQTEATGQAAASFGAWTRGKHTGAFTYGIENDSGDEFQFAGGKYNSAKAGARITGGGANTDNRKNIEELDWNGNLKIAGGLTLDMNGTPITLTAQLLAQLIKSFKYSITTIVNGGTYSGATEIAPGETATVIARATTTASHIAYLPDTILVTGADYTWNIIGENGYILLENPREDVKIVVNCIIK